MINVDYDKITADFVRSFTEQDEIKQILKTIHEDAVDNQDGHGIIIFSSVQNVQGVKKELERRGFEVESIEDTIEVRW